MHDLYVLTKLNFANQTMAIYGDYLVAFIRTLPIYTSRMLLILPYVSGVSVPAKKITIHIYLLITTKWLGVS